MFISYSAQLITSVKLEEIWCYELQMNYVSCLCVCSPPFWYQCVACNCCLGWLSLSLSPPLVRYPGSLSILFGPIYPVWTIWPQLTNKFTRGPEAATSKVFIIGNKKLSEVMDKEDKQDISEISDQIQKKFKLFWKNSVEFDLKLFLSYLTSLVHR